MTRQENLLYEKYRKQGEALTFRRVMEEEAFCGFLKEALRGMSCIRIEDGGEEAFLYYRMEENGGELSCYVPVYGYYAAGERAAVRLFTALAEKVVDGRSCHFSVNLYRNDTESIRTFVMMQFGIMSLKAVGKAEPSEETETGFSVKAFTKQEIIENWGRIWELTHEIVLHLQRSPVFYPGDEFTEDVYRAFYLDEGTEVLGAFDEGKLIDIIEWNRENDRLYGGEGSANAGEVYVEPAYRGRKIAEKLLYCAGKRAHDAGYEYLWVEHGTANPNARGFWDRYFEPYSYEMVREVL